MGSGKQHKEGEKIIQLELFPSALPVPDNQEPAPPAPSPKRPRTKKTAAAPADIPGVPASVEPPASVTPEPPAPPIPAEMPLKQENKEEELKVQFKKNQEARLAALRRARGMK